MKQYAAIHVGTGWATELTWGVMVQGIKPTAELLCVGFTQTQAEKLVAKLNEPSESAVRLKMAAPVAALLWR